MFCLGFGAWLGVILLSQRLKFPTQTMVAVSVVAGILPIWIHILGAESGLVLLGAAGKLALALFILILFLGLTQGVARWFEQVGIASLTGLGPCYRQAFGIYARTLQRNFEEARVYGVIIGQRINGLWSLNGLPILPSPHPAAMLALAFLLLVIAWPCLLQAVPVFDDTWMLMREWPANNPWQVIAYTQGRPLLALLVQAVKEGGWGWSALPVVRAFGFGFVLLSGIFLERYARMLGASPAAALASAALTVTCVGMFVLVGPGAWVSVALVLNVTAFALLVCRPPGIFRGRPGLTVVAATALLLAGLCCYQMFFWILPALAAWMLLIPPTPLSIRYLGGCLFRFGIAALCALGIYGVWWKNLPLFVHVPPHFAYGRFELSPVGALALIAWQRPLRMIQELFWPLADGRVAQAVFLALLFWAGTRYFIATRFSVRKRVLWLLAWVACWALSDASFLTSHPSLRNRENSMLTIPPLVFGAGLIGSGLSFAARQGPGKACTGIALLALIGLFGWRAGLLYHGWHKPLHQEAKVVRTLAEKARPPNGNLFVARLDFLPAKQPARLSAPELQWRNLESGYYGRYLLILALEEVTPGRVSLILMQNGQDKSRESDWIREQVTEEGLEENGSRNISDFLSDPTASGKFRLIGRESPLWLYRVAANNGAGKAPPAK